PILASILTLAAQQETLTAGTALLAVYAAGLGLPFVVAALFIGPFMRWAKGFRKHMGTVEKSMGGLLIVVGLMIMTGEFERLAYWMLETFPVLATLG
ncbi:MAG: cytochrome c biogenesis protein CcdA, partial [Pseudomonadota bacterium]